MKCILIFFTLIFGATAFAQTSPDAITGKWLKTPKEDLVIKVFKAGNEYKGKIIKDKGSTKGKHVGLLILESLEYDSDKEIWKGGKIHDPNSGRTYDAEAKINADGLLEVNCYMGMKFLGTKKYFKHVK